MKTFRNLYILFNSIKVTFLPLLFTHQLVLVPLVSPYPNNINSISNVNSNGESGGSGTRVKRNVAQLVALIYKETPYQFTKLSNYGNWCGKGGDKMGDGSSIDGCDLCCKNHDNCYYKARHDFPGCKPLLSIYDYRHGEQDPDVHIDGLNSEERRALLHKRRLPSCNSKSNTCKQSICQCDINFITCLKKEPCDPEMVSKQGGYWWIPW